MSEPLRSQVIEAMARAIFGLPDDVEPSEYMLGQGAKSLDAALSVLADHTDEWAIAGYETSGFKPFPYVMEGLLAVLADEEDR